MACQLKRQFSIADYWRASWRGRGRPHDGVQVRQQTGVGVRIHEGNPPGTSRLRGVHELREYQATVAAVLPAGPPCTFQVAAAESKPNWAGYMCKNRQQWVATAALQLDRSRERKHADYAVIV